MAARKSKPKTRRDGIERRVKTDGSVSYRVLVRRAGAPTISKTFRTYADARTYRQRMDADFSTAKAIGRAPLSLNKTVGDALDRYERDIMPGHRSQSSEKAFLGYWRDEAAQIRMMDLETRLPVLVDALAEAKGAGSTATPSMTWIASLRARHESA